MEPALEEGPGFTPRDFVVEAVAHEPDELAGQLRGVADHFLRGDALLRRTGRAPLTLHACDFLLEATRGRQVLTLDWPNRDLRQPCYLSTLET